MTPKHALITGVAGQDGRYLTDLLIGEGYEVFGMVGPEAGDISDWAVSRGARLHLVEGDMTSGESLERVIVQSAPDDVYNFAGLSSVGSSWQQAALVAEVNAVGVIRLLDALHAARPDARFCQASSADIFGLPGHSPQNESTEISPVSPYGASKAYAHFMTRSYCNIQKMLACNADLMVANDVGRKGSEMGSDTSEVFIIDKNKQIIHLPVQTKQSVARMLLEELTNYL